MVAFISTKTEMEVKNVFGKKRNGKKKRKKNGKKKNGKTDIQ
jgi:hypothetical protein